MDLIYTDEHREDVGVLFDYTFDLAFGSDENDFELAIDLEKHCCTAGCFIYIEGTEYGGIVDKVQVVTKNDKLVYSGRTWHGILAAKIIEPDEGNAYLTVSGEANAVLAALLERMKLTELFAAASDDSGFVINKYQFDRYTDGYSGIIKMLKNVSAKLRFVFRGEKVVLSAVPIVDYTKEELFETNQVEMQINKTYRPVNHLVCLGRGELTERQIVHLYADADGNISDEQSLFGLDEVEAVYDYSDVESMEELIAGGIERLKDYASTDNVKLELNADDVVYDVGDIVGAYEETTRTNVQATVTKKIVKISKTGASISYSCSKASTSTAQGSSSSGGEIVSFDKIYPIGSIYMSFSDTNPAVLFGGTWERIKDRFLLAAGDSYQAGSTGGEASHELSVTEMPSHGGHFQNRGGNYAAYMNQSVLSQYGDTGRGWSVQAGNEVIPATASSGSGSAHNNMPPYLTVYVWKRTA